jgi:hypothetical protein
MGMAYVDFSKSSTRLSFKRGLARQAITHAPDADGTKIFGQLADLRRNRKSQDRFAERLQRQPGVVRLAQSEMGMVFILRNQRQMITRVDDTDVFAEETLFYTRVTVRMTRNASSYHVSRASLTLHAIERLVERSTISLDRPLLEAVDAEAMTMLRNMAKARLIEDGDDHYAAALQSGVWAGRVDHSGLEPEWGLLLRDPDSRVPVFSARTFLSPKEMRPTVWLRWNADPSLTVC